MNDLAEKVSEEYGLVKTDVRQRTRRIPARLKDSVVMASLGSPTVRDIRSEIFYSMVDICSTELKRRFSAENQLIMKGIAALTPGSNDFLK